MNRDAFPDEALMAAIRISYQPIVRLADLRTAHVEVLARVMTADGTLDGPEAVLEAMDGTERSMRLTGSIMQRALAEYDALHFATHNLNLALNLPLDAMLHPGLMDIIERVRRASGVAVRNISFELTERHPVHDLSAARAAISDLSAAGYGLALDDITPQMTNLNALMAMPIRAIKLDRSVVVSARAPMREFIRDVSARATANGQDIVAEGIETSAMGNQMRNLGVTHGQGFLFCPPLPAAALREYLRAAGGHSA